MLEQHYGDIHITDELHSLLERLLQDYELPTNAKRIVLNCRQMSYYRNRQGIHPIEVQLKRESISSPWLIVCFTSFSYTSDNCTTVEPELYFHLINHWCYQLESGTTHLSHHEAHDIFTHWMNAFYRHLSRHIFDNIQLSLIRTFN
ncbi:TPA: DUF2787 domain-containing protein [Photobacterium damselae]|uniref:DUF2787 domain-containing protein n=1 Tax=Photobacterium damselae TaxID=38293 RepID=UPI00370BC62A